MPQGPIAVANIGDPSLSATGPISTPTQITVRPGELRSVENLVPSFLTTTAIAGLTSSQIGLFYDVVVSGVTSAMTALTTSQVASLSTSQLLAIATPTVGEVAYGGGNGIPVKNGLVFVPGAGQIGNALKK